MVAVGVASATAALRGVAREALRPPEKLSTDVWADRHRILPPGSSEQAGPWRTDYVPYLREPMRATSDPRIRRVTFRKATQCGGTEVLINALFRAIDIDPGHALYVYPSIDTGRKVNRERVTPALMACAAVRNRLRGSQKESVGSIELRFDRMTVFFVGSNSETNLAVFPCRYVFLDEIDAAEFQPRAVMLAEDRTKTFRAAGKSKIIAVSKPGRAGEGIDGLYQQSDQRVYWVPCPLCGRYQPLKWSGVKWDGGKGADPETVEKTAWYRCAHCAGRLTSADKPQMLAAGKWVAQGQEIDEAGVLVGPAPTGDHAGFTISSLYAPQLPFGYVARRFLECGVCPDWVCGDLGEAWEEPGDTMEVEAVRKHCVPVEQGGYAMPVAGTRAAPAGVLTVAGMIDLQRDRAYVEVRGFGEGALDSWLLWHKCVPLTLGDLRPLGRLVARLGFPHADGRPIGVAWWGIDSGDPKWTYDVYRWVMRHPNVVATKGRWGAEMGRPYDLKLLDWTDPNKLESGQCRFLGINTDHYKSMVLARIQGGGVPDAVTEAEGANFERPGRMYFPADTGDEYLEQITSEKLEPGVYTSGRNMGRPKYLWKLKPGREDNHYFDTCVGCMCIADAFYFAAARRGTFEAQRAGAVGAAAPVKAAGEDGFVGAGSNWMSGE